MTKDSKNCNSMDLDNPTIYGLETQARTLAPQLAENSEIRFFVATQTLKPQNQIHLVELNENASTLKQRIFAHTAGEIWKINSSPHNSSELVTCFSTLKDTQVVMKTAIYRLPDLSSDIESKEFLQFESSEILNTETYGSDIKTTEFHLTDNNLLATVIDNKVLLHERTASDTRVIAEINAKNSPKLTTGKWSQTHLGNQFITLVDCDVRSYDIRDPNHCAWSIEEAHSQMIRDLDCNPHKHCHFVTGGDDGVIKIWDNRHTKEPVFVRNDHQHWVWSVRFNFFHDQLLLSSSSDCKVLLTCAASVSSEATNEHSDKENMIPDGLLKTYDQHEDSVYCAEWSNVDPWLFASLSYDGRMCINRVPKEYKLKLLMHSNY